MSAGDVMSAVCLLSSPPNNYFRALKYDTLHWNKSIASLEIDFLPKYNKVKSESTVLTWVLILLCQSARGTKKWRGELMTVWEENNFTEGVV